MDIGRAKIRIEELTKILNEANRKYYIENTPTISDFEFDHLMKELENLETQFPDLIDPDSPTQKVGSDISKNIDSSIQKEFEQYPHKYQMLSLSNTYNITEVEDFISRALRSLEKVRQEKEEQQIKQKNIENKKSEDNNKLSFSCEMKFDGTAISLIYRNGKLFRALTRGDGTIGDDVTLNVKQIKNIPDFLTLPTKESKQEESSTLSFPVDDGEATPWPEEFEIRGEIYMPYSAFDRLNQERINEEETPFANPRNAAAGSLKLLDSKEVARRGLECTLYHVLGENLPFKTHEEALIAAKSWGLPISDTGKICHSIKEVDEYINYWDRERKYLPFATDGIVIKINQLEAQEELGFTAKFPRWAVAYKFKAEQALTRLISVDYQVGRTGAVTPVANLEPVQLSGTVVKRASLHNQDQMQLLDIHIDDYVYVEKGGEIIPKIVGVDLSQRKAGANIPQSPKHCPDCGTELIKDENEAKHFCPNNNGCPTQIKGKLLHFISRKAMNVIAGEATIEQLYNLDLVRNPADFYKLTKEQLLQLENWKDRSAERLLESLKESKDNTEFERVLFALGIRYVGETTAKSLAKHYKNIDNLIATTKEELLEGPDVGEVIAESVIQFFQNSKNIETIQRLKKAGLQFEIKEIHEPISNVLEGKTIVISGTFSISRDKIKDLIAQNGGKNTSSISKNTDYFLAGENCGPKKLQQVDTLGIKRISEEEFYKMISLENSGKSKDTNNDSKDLGTVDISDDKVQAKTEEKIQTSVKQTKTEKNKNTDNNIEEGNQLSLF